MIEASSASSSSSSSSAAAEASDLDLSQLPSFTFLPGISTSDENQVPQEFEELWPHKGSTADHHRWEIESSLGEILKEELASFRGTLNLPHQSQSLPLRELLWGTTEDLQCTNINCTSCIQISEINRESTHQVLFFFYKVLKSVEYSWGQNHSANCGNERDADLEDLDSQKLGERVLERLKHMNSLAKKKLDLREDSVNAVVPWNQQNKPSYLCRSQTSTPGLQEILDLLDMAPPLRPIRVKPERKLKATDRQQLSFHMVPLLLDQNPRPMYQTDQIDTNLILDSVDNMMSNAANSNSTIQNDGNYDLEIRTPGATIHASAPSMLLNRSLLQSPAASPRVLTDLIAPSSLPIYRSKSMGQILQDTSKDNDGSDEISKSSNTTILRAQTLPVLHLRVPSPPSLPMMLMKGVCMPSYDPLMSMEPIAFAITVDNFDDYLMSNMSVDGCDTSGALLSMAPPSTPTLRLTEAPPQSPPSPPTSPPPAPVQKKDMPISPAPVILTPPPPQPPGMSAPAPPPPPPIKGSTSSSPSPSWPSQASGSAPLPPSPSQAAGVAPPPPLPSQASGVAPPPPPMAMNALRAKNNTKLKRSSQMGSLYRLLKGKVEGASLTVKTSHQRKSQPGGKSGEDAGQGMADALAEITKRSSYFQQILEDVNKYSAEILELKLAINSFKTKDMTELVKFRQHVEMQLEKLSDESQVLARFEDFPNKKLETIRMAVALFSKLEVIVTTLKGWKVVSPVTKQLDKIETYFNKMKEEVDIIDRNKDEECKRFKSHNIELDFNVVVRIKECMVDLSSTCIEVALKESEEAKKAAAQATKFKTANLSKMLWRAFQLAFRVYNFAGGQDERADRLTHELAREIENQSQT